MLGHLDDDPNIPRIFHDFDEVEQAIKKQGFGRKVKIDPITKNRAKIGYKKRYECDDAAC